jgi:hypothetical protein
MEASLGASSGNYGPARRERKIDNSDACHYECAKQTFKADGLHYV